MPRNIVYRIIYEFCENVVYVSEHEKTRNDGTSRSCKITTSIIIKHTRHDGTSRSCKITTSIIIKHITQKETLKLQGFLNIYSIQPYMLKR
jgi:hypothetical protein